MITNSKFKNEDKTSGVEERTLMGADWKVIEKEDQPVKVPSEGEEDQDEVTTE